MFSANENIALRQHKKKVVQFVEECIPTPALDAGTSVMVMQVTCKAPGCVPLETAIVICFPRPYPPPPPGEAQEGVELIPGLSESKGGNFKTKVLLPLSQVGKEDVCDALPPCFIGGTRTQEKICWRVRDVTLGQITQNLVDEDVEGKRLMAEYLMIALKEYIDRGCVAPPIGEDYPPLEKVEEDKKEEDPEKEAELGSSDSNTTSQSQPIHKDDANPEMNSSVTEWKQRQKIEKMMNASTSFELGNE